MFRKTESILWLMMRWLNRILGPLDFDQYLSSRPFLSPTRSGSIFLEQKLSFLIVDRCCEALAFPNAGLTFGSVAHFGQRHQTLGTVEINVTTVTKLHGRI